MTEDEHDILTGRMIAWLSYFGLLFIIPLLARSRSSYIRFHVNQGIIYFMFTLAAGGAAAAFFLVPRIGPLLSFVLFLLIVFYLCFGIHQALGGKKRALPLIGRLKILSGLDDP